MDEQEWLACAEPNAMLECLWNEASDRKLTLFAVACCRRIWHLFDDGRGREAVEVAERYAEGGASDAELEDARRGAEAARRKSRRAKRSVNLLSGRVAETAHEAAFWATWNGGHDASPHRSSLDVLAPAMSAAGWASIALGYTLVDAALLGDESAFEAALEAARAPEQAAQCDGLRDLVGNPFRPVTLDPAWLTPDVVMLAQAAYDNRALPAGTLEPARLALLADALEEAGCDSADLLAHLRSEGPHVRGCWALDLVLGKG